MPTTAAEIMDRNFFYASQGDSILQVLHDMSDRGLSSAPVLDGDGRPVGVASLRDVESCHDIEELADHLSRSALSLPQSTTVEAAAQALAARQAESLVLVDDFGVAVGALSALDLLRALVGCSEGAEREASSTARSALAWSKAEVLELSAAHRAPAAPGVILLGPGSSSGSKRALWVEASPDIRERLDQMLRMPQDDPRLEALLDVYPRDLRFRCLVVHEPERRERLARGLGKLLGPKLAGRAGE